MCVLTRRYIFYDSQVVLYGTGCGMSAAFWRNQHNKHHATPQKVDHDVDLDTLPLVLFNVSCKEGKQKNMFNRCARLSSTSIPLHAH
jgi:fatty acid desaturase